MEPITLTTVITYVSIKFIDQFLKEEGYGRLKKLFFPRKKYQTRLTQIINETIEKFEKTNPIELPQNKSPFYNFQILYDELNKSILFNHTSYDYNSIAELFKSNSKVYIPDTKELEAFYTIFVQKFNNDTYLKKIFIEENYRSKIFNLGESLKKIENKIDKILSQTTFQPNQNWLNNQCKSSIVDLGKRYTPELNMILEVSKIFEGLGRTEDFKKTITDAFDQFLIKGKQILKNQNEINESLESLKNDFNELLALFNKTDFLGTNPIQVGKFEHFLNRTHNSIQKIFTFYITEERKIQNEKKEFKYYHKYGTELKNIRDFKYEISAFKYLIQSTSFKLSNNPFLLIYGDAGIGKSHLIGDIVSSRINKGQESIFILGQHFTTEEDPWTQIIKILQINSNSEDFLIKLNYRAKESRKRIILFIDAINEGKGIYFWDSFIKSFVNEIKKHEWLGLVITLRTSYKDLIIPEEEKKNLNIIEHHLYGFKNIEYEASKLFFDNFKIELPSTPLLHPEFQNPLFLKLFCEGISKAGLTRIPDGLQGITSIITFFIENINNVLSKPNRINYSNNLNLVQKSIYALLKYKIDNKLRFVSYEIAYKLIDNSVSDFIIKKGFIDELIKEGVLSKNLFWKEHNEYEDGVYLVYERFEDHLTVQYLLDQNQDLQKEIKKDSQLYLYICNERSILTYKGLIEALSIQIPERFGVEFHTLIPEFKCLHSITESFVESLLWRKIDTINEDSKDYVNECVFSSQDTYDLFWETILAVTGIPNHFFNAHFLHKNLIELSLPDRDANWTEFIKHRYIDESSVKRLIDWAWSQSDKLHISDESVLLTSITLTWFHTSSNRKLRDCATKALVCLLQERIEILILLLKKFERVNDPYVYERLFAIAYGCVLRTNQREKLAELGEYIYKIIFNNPEGVFPHILLRDYARGTIEYVNYIGIQLTFNLEKVRPPYKSTWPDNIPTLQELKEKYNNDKYINLWTSIMSYGDFARYIIGTNSRTTDWTGFRIGETPIDRNQIFNDFKIKLNNKQLKLLYELDPIISKDTNDNFLFGSEIKIQITIGRKTETELENIRESFKQTLSSKLLKEYENELEPFLDHNFKIINTGEYFDLRIAQRLILKKVIELGWNPDLHLSIDKEITTFDRDSPTIERLGKKYQWIAYYEYMSLLSDNFTKKDKWQDEFEQKYQGPWDPYVRDIDPTMIINRTGKYNDNFPENFWWSKNEKFNWNYTNEDWIKNSSDLPNIESLLKVKDDNGDDWLVMEGYPSSSEPKSIGEEKWDQPQKDFWCHIKSYLVTDSEFNSFKEWALEREYMGRRMPENREKYEIFSREYYWSPAHNYFKNEYFGDTDWIEVRSKNSDEYVAKVNITTQRFIWGEEFDKSKEGTISFLKPSNVIFSGMNLKYNQKEGELINTSGKLQCFAANIYHNSKPFLLIRKSSFLQFLNDKKLKIIWTVFGEKRIMGGLSSSKDFNNRLELNGTFYFENEELKGETRTKNT